MLVTFGCWVIARAAIHLPQQVRLGTQLNDHSRLLPAVHHVQTNSSENGGSNPHWHHLDGSALQTLYNQFWDILVTSVALTKP
jgi:hypothetical protein